VVVEAEVAVSALEDWGLVNAKDFEDEAVSDEWDGGDNGLVCVCVVLLDCDFVCLFVCLCTDHFSLPSKLTLAVIV